MEFNRALESIKSYEAGKPIELVVREFGIDRGDVVKLASNENPNGCSKGYQKPIAKNANMAQVYIQDDSFYGAKEGAISKVQYWKRPILINLGGQGKPNQNFLRRLNPRGAWAKWGKKRPP